MNLLRWATRAFAVALRAFPSRHREIYGLEMLDLFGHTLRSRLHTRGVRSALAFLLLAICDALRAGVGERRRQRSVSLTRMDHSDKAARRAGDIRMSWLDFKLGFRMLLRYPGLTVAAGLALAIAIGVGAAWYDMTGDLLRPRIPLPGGDRLVEIEMRNAVAVEEERRLMHDFLHWRRDLRSVEGLSAYRTIERNLIIGDTTPEPVRMAEITASAFDLTGIPPLIGRPLIAGDEHPAAEPVVVLGYTLWQQRFGGRSDVVGEVAQLGRTRATVVGVMPEGYAFPVNHRAWMPLRLESQGYAPLEGPPVRIFGRVVPEASQAQVNVEVSALADRTRGDSPRTHEHLRPRVLAYGGESPGDRRLLEMLSRHLPILLVLLVACANVATLIYARTATREAEIATRHALGASRGRIVGQLFAEALVLASGAAVVGLLSANWALKWGVNAYYSGSDAMPFWIDPGLKPGTVLFSMLLTVSGAAMLGILPALKATRGTAQAELRNLGAGRATLRFGGLWTTTMVAQVALTVVCLPPAYGISEEALRDRAIRQRFAAEEYLVVRVGLDRESTSAGTEEKPEDHAARLRRTYDELVRRIAEQPGVQAITMGDRLPGMAPAVRRAEVETSPGHSPVQSANVWTAMTGAGYFEAFDVPLLAGRNFHEGDRIPGAASVLVNQAFAQRFSSGVSPVGRRVRFASSDPSSPDPWFEIVGVVGDIGMTPTDAGEAPYVYRAARPEAVFPLVMAVRLSGDPADLAAAVRGLAAQIDPGLRLDEIHALDELVWRVDLPMVISAGAIAFVVALGLFLSAAGIFALMSVSVARRTREIGLRTALGATQGRLLAGVFSRAAALIGAGVIAGNLLLLLFVALEPEVEVNEVWGALLMTSAIMLTAGLVACVEPARRALQIQPTDALKDAG